MTPEEMRVRLTAAPVGRLGTIDPEGTPNLVPFVFVLSGDVLYTTVDGKPKRTARLQRLRNLERDPRVTVLVDHYEEDWKRAWWVRVRGLGRVVTDDDERGRAIAALREKYPQYGEVDPGEIVMAVEVTTWSGWSWED